MYEFISIIKLNVNETFKSFAIIRLILRRVSIVSMLIVLVRNSFPGISYLITKTYDSKQQ